MFELVGDAKHPLFKDTSGIVKGRSIKVPVALVTLTRVLCSLRLHKAHDRQTTLRYATLQIG
jgi:hypothetical protein